MKGMVVEDKPFLVAGDLLEWECNGIAEKSSMFVPGWFGRLYVSALVPLLNSEY